MSKFYILKPAVDTEEAGHVFPAVESYDDYDFNAPSSVHKLKTHVPFEGKPNLRFKLSNKANFTDLLSQSTINSAGLLISKTFLQILTDFEIIPFTAFSTEIKSNKTCIQYYWLHFIWEEWYKFVDWNVSTFRLFENGEFTSIEINSHSQYIDEVNKSQYFRIAPDVPVLLKINYDLYIHPFEGNLIISSQLVKKIGTAKMTGVAITPEPSLIA